MKQIKIDPNEIGKNIEIKIKTSKRCLLDFGFEGFNPAESYGQRIITFSESGTFFVENIYGKLKTKLVEGENLYLYYSYLSYPYYDYIEINYTCINLNHPNNDFQCNSEK